MGGGEFRNFEGVEKGWAQIFVTTDYHRFSQDYSFGLDSAIGMCLESVLISCNLVVSVIRWNFEGVWWEEWNFVFSCFWLVAE